MTARGLSRLSIRTRLFCAIGLLSVVATVIGVIAFYTLARADRQIELLHSVSLAEVSRALELSQSAATLSKSAPFLLSLNPPFGISTETDEIYAAIARLETMAQGDAELGLSVARMRAAVDDLVDIIPQQNRIGRDIDAIDADLERLLRRYRQWTTTRVATTYQRQAWSALQQLAMEAVGTARATTLISIGEFRQRYTKIRADILAVATPLVADNVQEIDRTITRDDTLFNLVYRNLAISLDAENALFRIRTEAERINQLAAQKVTAARQRLEASQADTRARLAVAQWVMLALMAISLVVAVVSAVFVSRYVVMNLHRIAQAMRRLAAGDRATRLERRLESDDEIGQLFSAFRIFRANALRLDRNSRLIRRQNTLFSRVFENITDGVVITAASGRILAQNLRTRDLLRLPDTAQAPETVDDLLAQSPFALRDTAMTAAGYLEYESAAGHVLELRRSPFPDGGAVWLFSEVTERRLVDARLAEIQRVETLGKVTGEVAHDFGNILSTISGNLHLLERADPETARRLRARIEDAVDLGVTLTERLLAFARKQHLEPQRTDIVDLLNAMRDLLEIALPETAVLSVTTPDGPIWAMIDPGQLESAILNLCVNAGQAISDSGHIEISVARTDDDQIALSVADDGHGMPAETLRYATEPFFTARRDGSGTGLGLSMVDGFVHQSGGSLHIASQPDAGTTVTLLFPPIAEAAALSARHAGYAVVIDDDPKALTAAATALRAHGFDVTTATDYASGRALLTGPPPPDLVLSDLKLDAQHSGWDLIRLALERHPQTRAIAMSTQLPRADSIDPADRDRFARLEKPVSALALEQVLARLLPPTAD
jgi:signal transduction histidine kinase/CheY-like chemotaxis protein/predicted pyridoxine 5'-phosphate oxidase superfamily flavin-nucleotide-binding protein